MRALVITQAITRRDEKSLNSYLNEISKYDVLTPEEEVELFHQYSQGDEKALEKIIKHNLRFVVSVAKQYQNIGMWLGDLVNEGNIGLLKAARRFDVTRGFKFISYAVWWIRQSILHALNEKGRNIRLPMNFVGNMSKINEAIITFLQKNERIPTHTELMEMTDLPMKTIKKSLKHYKKTKSLDAPIASDTYTTLGSLKVDKSLPSPDSKVYNDSLKIEVKSLLNALPQRQADVLSMYFGINQKHALSLDDIGYHYGITRERARQIKDKGIRRLRRVTMKNKLTFTLN